MIGRLFHHCQYRQQREQGTHQRGCRKCPPFRKRGKGSFTLSAGERAEALQAEGRTATSRAEVLHATDRDETEATTTPVKTSPPQLN